MLPSIFSWGRVFRYASLIDSLLLRMGMLCFRIQPRIVPWVTLNLLAISVVECFSVQYSFVSLEN
jgi:hypothetical protein